MALKKKNASLINSSWFNFKHKEKLLAKTISVLQRNDTFVKTKHDLEDD